MKWALIFWIGNPANFSINSVYLSHEKCLERQAYYQEKFTDMKAECRPARQVKLNTPTSIKVIKETIPG